MRPATGRAAGPPAAALLAVLLACVAPAGSAAQGLAPPAAADGRAVWGVARRAAASDTTAAAAAGAAAIAFARGDSLAGWALRAADTSASPVALREYARACLARGLAAAADSVLGSPRLAASAWAWQALRTRAGAALAAADTARAESLLALAGPERWPEGDRAARQLLRARLALARGRTTEAEELARQTVRLYPSLAPAAPALALLDSLAAARGDSLSLADERAGAEVDAFRGARGSAARRLRHARPRAEAQERWALALRLAEVLRGSRMPVAARAAAETALALAPDAEAGARAALEKARALRDAGATDSALASFAAVGVSGAGATLRATAWWEYAREAEDESRWAQALEGLREVAALAGRRADEARVRAGLVHFVRGEPDSARRWWAASASEAARFWLGVSLRASDRAASDTLLGALARLPGYAFHRAAARETLGVRGWPAAITAPGIAGVAEGSAWDGLLEWGLPDEAILEMSRWAARERPATGAWLRLAERAYGAGRLATGTRWAESAFAGAAGESLAWAAVAWAYPPAFEAEVVAAETLGVERALLWALIRQESRFDPLARSRSDALGLAQLKLATAGDVAKWLREPKPGESALFAPDTSIRFGARYLARMLERFGGVTAVALAAYNAGPGTIRRDWRELLARGGEALYAEFASNADSQDYTRRILGFRQAYRELRPTAGP